ncbi:phosphotransferase family protein [Nereida sp. MMG025]|uniref:phosphotransferase family protein n=1 Tax=Nereida sp. MMG025 TaxID=2909981 RepID=UPI001F19B4BC|nr:phosphotransferase family protein [Nereida sp. MMG025]MCF6445592.1 phosphotransferase family protein [Nereida sp. MMG025]
MHSYDHATLQMYLQRHVEGMGPLDKFEKFSDGQSNPTYLVSSGRKRFVLRAQPLGTLLPGAHRVDREFRVMQALAATPIPVPKVFHLSDGDTPLGSQFFVMEHIAGRVFWDPALPDQTPQTRGAIYDAMNKALADLHDVRPDRIGLGDYGKPSGFFARQLRTWRAAFAASQTEALPDADWLGAWLEEAKPADDGSLSLVHGDFRIDNMMFAPDAPTVAALLDWELSTLGHPMSDLAYQCMHWRLPHKGVFKGLGGLDRKALGLPLEDEYVAAYCTRRAIPAPKDWTFYLAFAHFRFLAILQGVLRRSLDGNASNPLGNDAVRDVIADLALQGRALAQKAG